MSKIASRKVTDGDIQNKSQTTTSPSRKTRKKPMKSNITSKMRTRRSDVTAPGDIDGEDEGNDDAAEDADDTAEDPDVAALSGAHRQRRGETGKRLTGHKSRDEDLFKDQALAGADEVDYEGSDEDDYDDLENVSDDEDDGDEAEERRFLKSASKDLAREFKRHEQRRDANVNANANATANANADANTNANAMTTEMNSMALDEDEALARKLSLQGSDSPTEEINFDGIDFSHDPFYGFDKDENTYRDLWDEAETAMWRMPDTARSREINDPVSAAQKRVRFEEVQPDSSSDSDSDDPNETYPDLLNESDISNLKQKIALDMTNLNDINDTESFYDFDEDEGHAFEVDEESGTDQDRSNSDSEDLGEETDEEDREDVLARLNEKRRANGDSANGAVRKRVLPKKATPSVGRVTQSPSTSRPTTPKNVKDGPKMGRFEIDPSRAIMTAASDGKKVKLLPPTTPSEKDKAFWDRAKTASNSRDGSPGSSYLTISTPRGEEKPDRPLTTEATLGTSLFDGDLDLIGNHDVQGIAETTYPTLMTNSQLSFTSATTMGDSDETDRQDVNMQDFFDFDDSDSDSDTDGPPTGALTSPAESDMFDTLMNVGTPNRRGSGLMDHFDQYRGVVGSFRRNQNQVKHVSSLASHPAKRASAHEYNALQKGRRGAANTPMTPARKNRASQDMTPNSAGIRKSMNSPLAARRPRSRGGSLVGVNASDLYQTLAQNPFDQA